MSENEVKILANALRQLTPAAPPLDRDALMFRAGRASAPRPWLWPLTTAACSLLALGLGLVLAPWRTEVVMVDRIVQVPAPAPEADKSPPPPPVDVAAAEPAAPATSYQRAQEQVLRWGLDALPPTPAARPADPFLLREMPPF